MSKLDEACKGMEIVVEETDQNPYIKRDNKWSREATHYTVRLTYKGRELNTYFSMGKAHANPPTAAAVLYSLLMDQQAVNLSFEDWCNEFGYSSDSRAAYATYRSCRKVGRQVKPFLGEELPAFEEAANDY